MPIPRLEGLAFLLLKTSQGKFTTECINFLVENGPCRGARGDPETLADRTESPRARAVVGGENRQSKKFAKLLNELITPRLFSAIFFAIGLRGAAIRRNPPHPAGRDPQRRPRSDSRPALHGRPRNGRDLANTLLLNQGFEELTKKSLLARFIKIFPSIQSLGVR